MMLREFRFFNKLLAGCMSLAAIAICGTVDGATAVEQETNVLSFPATGGSILVTVTVPAGQNWCWEYLDRPDWVEEVVAGNITVTKSTKAAYGGGENLEITTCITVGENDGDTREWPYRITCGGKTVWTLVVTQEPKRRIQVRFSNSYLFRDGLRLDQKVANIADKSQQPIVGDSCGLQTTVVFKDGTRSVADSIALFGTRVYFAYKQGFDNWGWGSSSGINWIPLCPVETGPEEGGTNLTL